ncbi:hypothetical protein EI555_006185 [Monodon monoceros]|uniref:N-terminal Ras-GEF domain-containing protein n=1 Tax=Monodon monoceros TaxID=40151 RepID=A0A4V6WNU4_MONMO|nr:hypothetical protein EI555_006185 [Monodon monoceros]
MLELLFTRAVSSMLGTWLHYYPEHFHQPPEFPRLKMLLAYTELSMPGSDLEQQAHLLLAQLEHLEPPEAEGVATAPAPEQALETYQDLEPATPLLPTTAPEPEQAQATAIVQAQEPEYALLPAPQPELENGHALALT